MARALVTHLQNAWKGPAIDVCVGDEKFTLGQGAPSTAIVIEKKRLIPQLLRSPSLTFGEGYMRGDIKIEGNLLNVLHGFYATWEELQKSSWQRWQRLIPALPQRDSVTRAIKNAQHHYDIGNEFYKLWLDQSLTYSCAYFNTATDTLAQAQEQKIDLLLQKLQLQPGQKLLDIGCGWGALLFRAIEKYDVEAYGITPSLEQAQHIRKSAAERGLTERITILNDDWRKLSGQFDRVVSVGMFEHVGQAQYSNFFNKWHELLTSDGMSVLHTIGRMKYDVTDPWITRYIFPGGYLPTLTELTEHATNTGLTILHVENLRSHYAKTLEHWATNFEGVRQQVEKMYDEEFVRMWRLYLLGSQAGFTWGGLHLWQLVLTKQEQPDLSYRWHLK